MSSEPEALVLASKLESGWCPDDSPAEMQKAAAELRRLHVESATLTDSCAAKADRIDRIGEMVERLTAEREADRAAMREALEVLEESIPLVRSEYMSDWRHGIPSRKAQLDAMKGLVEAHEAAIEKLKARAG